MTRRAVFALLLLALLPGPALARCTPAAGGGCCCHKGKCATSMGPKAQTCCNSQDSVPAPATDVAPTTSTPQLQDLPPKPEVAAVGNRASLDDRGSPGETSPREAPADLYTLHASLLI